MHLRAQAAEFQKRLLTNETRFILAVVAGDLVVSNRRRADIIADLEAGGYDKMPPNKKVRDVLGVQATSVLFEQHVSGSCAQPQHQTYCRTIVSRQWYQGMLYATAYHALAKAARWRVMAVAP